jgi:diaminopimelate epimerase
MKEYSYQIYIPGGNATALVFDLENNLHFRKTINDTIMEKFPYIEQVGFLSSDPEKPELIMAGNEFCGNATRCAAWHFLKGIPGEISLKVSGVDRKLRAGVTKEYEAWAEMPVNNHLKDIKEVSDGFYLVEMEGISHIVITPEQSQKYLGQAELKTSGKEILAEYQLLNIPAAGIIFTEKETNAYKIHPCVYVSAINTLFYETACGSGTIATGLVIAMLRGKNIEIPIIQPSSKIIKAIVCCESSIITKAIISGKIDTDGVIYKGLR